MEKNESKLTVIIPTFNVEQYIEKQFSHLYGFADEILVCDSFSTDKTLEIAKKAGVRIIQHEYINSAKQKNWAIPQASYEWVLVLDSDELLEDALKAEIRNFLNNVSEDVELAWIPRKNLFWGTWMRYASAYPDYQSRLFSRDKGRYDGKEVHSHVVVPGKSVKLKNHIIHDDFTDISSWWLRTNRYLRYELDESIKNKRVWTFRQQFIYPIIIFLRDYLYNKGLVHGFPGLFRAFLEAKYYFMIQAKLYEYELSKKRKIRQKTSNPF